MLDLLEECVLLIVFFYYIGMDVFGLFYIKEGCKILKCYGLIFICFVFCVVYLEILNLMEVDFFISVLCCFINR